MNDRGDKLRSIEERIFVDVIKEKIIKESGAWNGSKKQAKDADKNVFVLIRYSLKCSRQTRKLMKTHFQFLNVSICSW